tara:strand:+ start:290 stop:1609 length:1320 start_codon:yes stop_codon:yes gene_type:complete
MAFLDNSGDIILDAVLTDAGRKRMAEGKFNIAKYAFGDEEINYELFNNNHPSGSAFYDLQIMQTPILEAFTNNTSTMSSKLMTLNDNNFLYLPTLKLNEAWGEAASGNSDTSYGGGHSYSMMARGDHRSKAGTAVGDGVYVAAASTGSFVVTVDSDTEDLFKFTDDGVTTFTEDINYYPEGLMLGASPNSGMNGGFICVDQGIGGTNQGLSIASDFPDELRETAYMIRIDNRLGRIIENGTAPRRFGGKSGATFTTIGNHVTSGHYTERIDGAVGENHSLEAVSNAVQSYAFVDDDNIATYYITTQQNNMLIPDIKTTFNGTSPLSADMAGAFNRADKRWRARNVFDDGPVGSRLMFSIKAQETLQASFDLFGTSTTQLARRRTTGTIPAGNPTPVVPDANATTAAGITCRYIDTTVSVIGVTTGYRLDIPVRFVKKSS